MRRRVACPATLPPPHHPTRRSRVAAVTARRPPRVAADRLRTYERAALCADRAPATSLDRLERHLSAATTLARGGDLTRARAAADVATVVGLRLAVSPATSAAHYHEKWDGLVGAAADGPLSTPRVVRLLGSACNAELWTRLGAGLSVDRGEAPSGGVPPPRRRRTGPRRPARSDLRLYERVAGWGIDAVAAYEEVRRTSADMTALRDARPDRIDACRAHLADLALGLAARPATSAGEAALQTRLLEAMLVSLWSRPTVVSLVRVGVEEERRRWGGPVLGRG